MLHCLTDFLKTLLASNPIFYFFFKKELMTQNPSYNTCTNSATRVKTELFISCHKVFIHTSHLPK